MLSRFCDVRFQLRGMRRCQLWPAADITLLGLPPLCANNRREQVQLIGAEAGRPRTRTRSVWSTPQGPLGCPKLRWHQLCARRDSSGARAAISRSSIAGQTDAPTICRSWPPRLAQPPNESVGRLALRRGGVVALRPNIASPMSPLMSQLSAKSCRYAGSIP